jgi:hypothetical protein
MEGCKATEITKEGANLWRELSSEEKQKYIDTAHVASLSSSYLQQE